MNLLIFTQVVDEQDPVLGFFHAWITQLSKNFNRVTVICLKEGRHVLPQNVRVLSLGKEGGRSRLKYVTRFYRYVWSLRDEYDAVFVHMNQEYVLLGGWLWRLLGKSVYLWRNFHSGNLGTDMAALFAKNVFYTSRSSYTARYKHSLRMPVGVDVQKFSRGTGKRIPRSILSIGRIAPVKRIEVLIEALGFLNDRGVSYLASVYGDPLPEDEAYLESLKDRTRHLGISKQVTFHPGIPNTKAPLLYRAHEIFVNLSPSGMYDKTIIEAAACGTVSIAASRDWEQAAGPELSFDGTSEGLAARLRTLIEMPGSQKERLRERARIAAEGESLTDLSTRLAAVILGALPR